MMPFIYYSIKFADRHINHSLRKAMVFLYNYQHTIAFYFKPDLAGIIALTSFGEYHCTIISPNSVHPKGDALAPMADFVGTGPWKVAEYKKDQYTVFVPNQYYYEKKPILKKVTLRIYYIGGPERRKYTRIDGRFNPEAPEFSFGYFSSPELTPVLKKAVGSFNATERRKNFKIFYNQAKELAAGVPLYYEAVFVVAKPNVKNIRYISSEPRFDTVYIGK
jgi:ABC-type transport system substrate-binding protein